MSRQDRIALFKQFDLNHNGVISQNEWNGDQRSFARLELNKDGLLMREEFIKSYRGPR